MDRFSATAVPFPASGNAVVPLIPSHQFPYMHTFIRLLQKDNTNLTCFRQGAESGPLLLADMPRIALINFAILSEVGHGN
jgi:hypothetical protein